MSDSRYEDSKPPRPPLRNAQTLPPTYLIHLSALLRQFLSQQLHKPDPALALGATQKDRGRDECERPIWDAAGVDKLHQAIWEGAMLHAHAHARGIPSDSSAGAEDGKAGLLGCDWDTWLEGAVKRRRQMKEREAFLNLLVTPMPTPAVQDVGGRGRVMVGGSGTPSRHGTRESSVVSKQRDAASSVHRQSSIADAEECAKLDMEEYCDALRGLPGFVAFGEQESWDLVADTSPARTPIRELPGAFPQMASAWSPQNSTSRTPAKAAEPPVPLPEQLIIALCVHFVPATPAMTSHSSASTMRTARESSAEAPSLSTILSPPQLQHPLSGMFSGKSQPSQAHEDRPSAPGSKESQGSGGRSSGLGLNWWPSKWGEAKGRKVEVEFVPGRFALPRGRRRLSSQRGRSSLGADEGELDGGDSDSESDSDDASQWSGTQRAYAKDTPESLLLSGVEPDLRVDDGNVGVVGGTFVIRGIHGEEERAALVRVLKGVIYSLQSQLLELALLQAFGIPREPDTPRRSLSATHRSTSIPANQPTRLDAAAIPAGTVKKHSTFFSKLGLESRGRNVLDGLMGRKKSVRPRLEIPHSAFKDVAPGRMSLDTHRLLAESGSTSQDTNTPTPHAHSRSHSISQAPSIVLSRTESTLNPSTALHGIDRHLATLKRLEDMLHSTTPGLVFPLPRILLRVRDEDKIRREKALEEIKAERAESAGESSMSIDGLPMDLAEDERKLEQAIKGRAAGYRLGGDVRVGLGALASAIEGCEGWCRLQRLDVLTWDAVPDVIPEDGELEKGHGLGGPREKDELAEDARATVTTAEAPKVGSEESKAKTLPETSTARSPPAPTFTACTKPTVSIHRYHDRASDLSIADFMSEMTDELGGSPSLRRTPPQSFALDIPRRGSSPTKARPDIALGSSPRSGRSSPTKRDYQNPPRRLSASTSTVSVEAAVGASISTSVSTSQVDLEASTWENVCVRKGCDAAAREHVRVWVQGSRRVVASFGPGVEGVDGLAVMVERAGGDGHKVEGPLKGIAGDMSFHKFLELILYTTLLVPPQLRSPSPATDSPTLFIYTIRSTGLSITFTVSDVPVLDARLPKLQVGPNVVKRRLGSGGAQAAFDGVLRKGWAETTQENVRGEIRDWVGGMRLRVHYLRREMMSRDISQDAKDAALDTLQGLLNDIDSTEKALQAELYSTSAAQLNDTRVSFCTEQARLQKALDDWMAGNKAEIPVDFPAPCPVPEYVPSQGKELCIPGGSVLVRLDEPGSVIAFTLSSKVYFGELCTARGVRSSSEAGTPEDSAFTTPDTGRLVAEALSAWTVEVKRKETPRDLLSLRTVTKKRSEASLPLRAPLSVTPNQPSLELNLEPVTGSGVNQGERMDEIVKTISKATAQDPILTAGSYPGSAAASIRSLRMEDGRTSPTKRSASASLAPSLTESDGGRSDPGPLSANAVSTEPIKPSPLKMRRRLTDEAPPSAFRRSVSATMAPMTPRSEFGLLGTPPRSSTPNERDRDKDKENQPQTAARRTLMAELPEHDAERQDQGKEKEGWGSMTSTFTNNFAHLLKFGTGMTDSLASRVRPSPLDGGSSSGSTLRPTGGSDTPSSARSRSLASAFMNPLSQFNSLSIRGGAPDRANTPSTHRDGADGGLSNALSMFYNRDTEDKPHIQFNFTLPGKTRISCTVYYAAAFDTLRRRCAVDRSFVKSLENTIGWAAEGGKSKASFWKSEDGRLVVKELVSKWNVSDMQALLEVAPAYFEHMANTHNRATSLAKIVGFFSVKVHDIQSAHKRSMDLLVMENLWWQQDIGKQYDLKGIEGRRVPKGREDSSTLFDAEWLDAQTKNPILLNPAAKRILLESLAFDTRFLSQQSIMDYSLLLGLDKEKPEVVVGLVDAVGSYGLFKNIESRGKMAFNRGREGEVTIIPPDQYRDRFETALRQYFTVAPDKWSRAVRRAPNEGNSVRGMVPCGQGELPTVF